MTIAAGGRELMRDVQAIDKVTQAQIRAELHCDLGITFAQADRSRVWEVEHTSRSDQQPGPGQMIAACSTRWPHGFVAAATGS